MRIVRETDVKKQNYEQKETDGQIERETERERDIERAKESGEKEKLPKPNFGASYSIAMRKIR